MFQLIYGGESYKFKSESMDQYQKLPDQNRKNILIRDQKVQEFRLLSQNRVKKLNLLKASKKQLKKL